MKDKLKSFPSPTALVYLSVDLRDNSLGEGSAEIGRGVGQGAARLIVTFFVGDTILLVAGLIKWLISCIKLRKIYL